MNRLLSIQYLRALAVLMVLGYHACLFGWRDGFEIGAAGVDIFFVISGFILWTIAHERPAPPRQFLLRRLERVAPLYWIVTLAVVVICLKWPGAVYDANPRPGHVILSLAFIHHLNPSNRPNPVIPVGWSLNDEVVFYLIFSACLTVTAAKRFRALAAGLIGVWAVGCIVPLFYYLGFNLMFLQFLAGAWLAKVRLEEGVPFLGWGRFLVGWGIVVFIALSPLNLFQTFGRPLTWGLPAVALVAGAVTIETRGGLKDVWPLRFLGDASYSIYLVHWPVLSLLGYAMDRKALVYLPVGIGTSLAVGIAVHLLLERPLLRLFHERLGGAALPSRPT